MDPDTSARSRRKEILATAGIVVLINAFAVALGAMLGMWLPG